MDTDVMRKQMGSLPHVQDGITEDEQAQLTQLLKIKPLAMGGWRTVQLLYARLLRKQERLELQTKHINEQKTEWHRRIAGVFTMLENTQSTEGKDAIRKRVHNAVEALRTLEADIVCSKDTLS